jgi:hypothetical protein
LPDIQRRHGGLFRIASDPSFRRNGPSRKAGLSIPLLRFGRTASAEAGQALAARGSRTIHRGCFTSLDDRFPILPPIRFQDSAKAPAQRFLVSGCISGPTPCGRMHLDAARPLQILDFSVRSFGKQGADLTAACHHMARYSNSISPTGEIDGWFFVIPTRFLAG